jgi:hypothetical protein
MYFVCVSYLASHFCIIVVSWHHEIHSIHQQTPTQPMDTTSRMLSAYRPSDLIRWLHTPSTVKDQNHIGKTLSAIAFTEGQHK